MKKIFLSTVVLVTFFSCNKQEQPTPKTTNEYTEAEVNTMTEQQKLSASRDVLPSQLLKDKLAKDFPTARDIDWERSGNNLYEASFEIGGKEYEALYDEKASLIRYMVSISVKEFGDAMQKAVLAKYPDFRIDEVKKITEGSKTTYKVSLENKRIGNETELHVLYGENQEFIKEVID